MFAKQMSEDTYLAMEQTSKVRHEYVDSYLFAMADGSYSYNKIAMNKRSYYYPDLMLGCSKEETNAYYITKLCLLIEILSKSTAIIDKLEKLITYQSMNSLREYCLVS